MSEREFTLAIETAVQGGSISLLRGDTELDYWIGTQEISKSEDILVEIKKILERNDLKKSSIKKIAVSRGPGSYTGLRIGMSIGYALKKAVDCELVGLSVLKAMLRAAANPTFNCRDGILVAVPLGRDEICRQSFTNNHIKEKGIELQPQIAKIGNFFHSLSSSESKIKRTVILHQKLYLALGNYKISHFLENNLVINAGENIAGLIGKTIAIKDEYEIYRPMYVRDR